MELYVVYYRCEAEVTDLRKFENEIEFIDWFRNQLRLEPTIIIGIYGESSTYGDAEKDTERIMKFIKKN